MPWFRVLVDFPAAINKPAPESEGSVHPHRVVLTAAHALSAFCRVVSTCLLALKMMLVAFWQGRNFGSRSHSVTHNIHNYAWARTI